MALNLRTAAQQAGVSKSTILRAVKSGRLSASRTADMGYDIEPAELFRVYPPQRSNADAMGQDATSASTVSYTHLTLPTSDLV